MGNKKEIQNKIKEILTAKTIQENLEYLLQVIPELVHMIGFDQKHPHHHLDVWGHTLETINHINNGDIEILMAALLHDIGKPFSYQDEDVRHFHGHPEVSAKMTKEILTRLKYTEPFIRDVNYLVEKHDTIIDPDHLDNTYEMVWKRLQLQYADAKAHAPGKIEKRLRTLDQISNQLGKNRDCER